MTGHFAFLHFVTFCWFVGTVAIQIPRVWANVVAAVTYAAGAVAGVVAGVTFPIAWLGVASVLAAALAGYRAYVERLDRRLTQMIAAYSATSAPERAS